MLHETLEHYGLPTLATALKDINSLADFGEKINEYITTVAECLSLEFEDYGDVERYIMLKEYLDVVQGFVNLGLKPEAIQTKPEAIV